jgi:nucleoside phosphorylase
MAFRTPADVREEFRSHPRRALIITTVKSESLAVKAHLTDPELLVGEKSAIYEVGRFADPAGEWFIVHAITPQGNSDAGLVASTAYTEFGDFDAQLFVGVAGSLKDDIPIGSVVVGDYVHNGHAAKVEDEETLGRPIGMPAARELLTASEALIYSDEWRDLIRAPFGMELPKTSEYPCDFPPDAVIKGIVSGEEVVAGGKSPRFAWLRRHFNHCGAVEMEGWGVMNAAHYQNGKAIVVRGISDMCAGKDAVKDKLHQPIAAAHAAAFAFSILSFRSKVPVTAAPRSRPEPAEPPTVTSLPEERRVEFVLNFEGSLDEWPQEKVDAVLERMKKVVDDEKLTLVRIDQGSVRLVMNVRESDLPALDLSKLRELAAETGGALLGATTMEALAEAETAKSALAAASVNLLSWDKTLPNGKWMKRPEQQEIEARFQAEGSSTVLLGDPGSGKSALLSKVASDLLSERATVFGLKADFLSTEVATEADLQRELGLPALPSDLIVRLSALQPVFVFIDQLDALASQLDLKSGRLNVLLNLVRRIGGLPNVHVLLSARTFEFNHDVRLRAIDADSVTLALPPWHEVKEELASVGIDPDFWPEKARDVVRIPQALKTFIGLVGAGRKEPFTTYQAMLEQLWQDRIASADDSESLIKLAADLAGQMAEEEALWLAVARYDDRLGPLRRLEALGFIVRSENKLSVAFSHQTVFDYVLARTFVRNAGLLSTYVLERQDSLFVRAKIWSALNYLREAEVGSYERELRSIWETKGLRRHLRLLLIEFLGQVSQPLEFEKTFVAEVLASAELRLFGLKAISTNTAWFEHFASTAIRDAMSGPDPEANQALRILIASWKNHGERVAQLIREGWLPHRERDGFTWSAIEDCPVWTEDVFNVAAAVLKRSPISIWAVDHAASRLAVEQPDLAARVVRLKLDFILVEAKAKDPPPPYPEHGTEDEQLAWHIKHRRSRDFNDLLEATEWHDLPALAEAAPAEFLKHLWPWYLAVFQETLGSTDRDEDAYLYAGRYVLEIELTSSQARSEDREKPLLSALQIAVEELAEKTPQDFLTWANENSNLDILAVQQLIADGYQMAVQALAPQALDWVLADMRRFQLGTRYGHRETTTDLLRAAAPLWSTVDIERIEKAIRDYQPTVPKHLTKADQRKLFADSVRATKKDLLQAIGIERLSAENRELVVTEQRALGDRFDRSMGEVEGGWIGSPMEAGAMSKAKDRDILKIFGEIPDNTDWDHPTRWMRGGNIQLSRAFAEFAKTDPERAVRVMEQFEPLKQEIGRASCRERVS